jgi:hypothetical protein
VQGVRRLGRSLRVASLTEVLKTTAARVCRVEKLQPLKEVEEFPQGVQAKSSFRSLKLWKSSAGIGLRNPLKDKCREAAIKSPREVSQVGE